MTNENNNRGPYIQAKSCKFYPFDPKPEEIFIEDIAHALSNICRYNGHTKEFYSVAQHSVLVSKYCKPEHALHGLLHDAAEAYVGDMVRPIKNMNNMSFFRETEDRICETIFNKFHLTYPYPEDIKLADDMVLAIETRCVLDNIPDWAYTFYMQPPDNYQIIYPIGPRIAKRKFLDRWGELWDMKRKQDRLNVPHD